MQNHKRETLQAEPGSFHCSIRALLEIPPSFCMWCCGRRDSTFWNWLECEGASMMFSQISHDPAFHSDSMVLKLHSCIPFFFSSIRYGLILPGKASDAKKSLLQKRLSIFDDDDDTIPGKASKVQPLSFGITIMNFFSPANCIYIPLRLMLSPNLYPWGCAYLTHHFMFSSLVRRGMRNQLFSNVKWVHENFICGFVLPLHHYHRYPNFQKN